MKRFHLALAVLAAIVLVDALGFLVAMVLPAFQNAATPPKGKHTGTMRIISLSPSTTEMLFLLGAGKSLVGVTEYCNYPPEAKQIERVGGFARPNVEKLLSLAPDLVVSADLHRCGILPVLTKSGIRALDVRVGNIDDMFQAMRDIGDAVGRRREADDAVAAMKAKLRDVAARLAKRKTSPRVFVESWDEPLMTVGAGSFLDDVISRAGGVNVAHGLSQPNPRISAEKVIEWDPDVIIIAHMAKKPSSPAEIGKRIGWSDLKAVKRGKVICDVPSDLILHPGPRLIEAVEVLADRLSDCKD